MTDHDLINARYHAGLLADAASTALEFRNPSSPEEEEIRSKALSELEWAVRTVADNCGYLLKRKED